VIIKNATLEREYPATLAEEDEAQKGGDFPEKKLARRGRFFGSLWSSGLPESIPPATQDHKITDLARVT